MHIKPWMTAAVLIALFATWQWRSSQARSAEPEAGAVAVAHRNASTMPNPQPAERIALLVGIGRYSRDSTIPELAGAINDVRAMRALLIDRFAFAADDVLVLEDERATLEGIVRAFQAHLIERAVPETQALFFFAGHGSQTPDRSNLESGGFDSTYVAYDSRSGDRRGEFDLTDDMLASLLAALERRTEHVVVITDSCHSGGGVRGSLKPGSVRGLARGTRALDLEHPGAIAPFWPPGIELRDDDAPRPRALHIAACGAGELARERPGDASMQRLTHGALSIHLIDRLEHAVPDDTWRTVCDDVSVAMSCQAPWQRPEFVGGELDFELFGGRFNATEGYTCLALSDRSLLIRAGFVAGLRTGSVLSMRENRAGDAVEVGRAEVMKLRGHDASARWIGAAPDVPLGRALRAVEITRAGGLPPAVIWTSDARARGLVPMSELFEFTDLEGEAELRLTRGAGDALALETAEGICIWRTSGQGLSSKSFSTALHDELRFRALSLLTPSLGSLQIKASFQTLTESEVAELDNPRSLAYVSAALEPAGTNAWRTKPSSAAVARVLRIEIHNPSDRPFYVSAISFSEDRHLDVAIPESEGASLRLLDPGQSTQQAMLLGQGEHWSADRPMRDRYLFIATSVPTFDPYVLARRDRAVSDGELPEILRDCLPRLRGEPNAIDPESIGVAVLDLWIDPR